MSAPPEVFTHILSSLTVFSSGSRMSLEMSEVTLIHFTPIIIYVTCFIFEEEARLIHSFIASALPYSNT